MKNNQKLSIQKIISGTIVALVAGITLYLLFTPTKQHKKVILKTPHTKPASQQKVSYPDMIKGQIITLKKLTADSAFDYYTAFDEDVRTYLEFPAKVSYGYIERYVRGEAKRIEKKEMIAYNIWNNQDNKMVGSIQIRELNDYDPGQLGMWLNKNYRGGGRIQESLYLVSKAYFDTNPSTDKYNAHVRPWNPRSERSMIKFGFKKVGDYIEDGKITRHILELYRDVINRKARQ
ncbi:GNAT family N-acetyltransferase [Candidatus Dependentiae bacterium]|nr:GNAT family N-acetyltransferase [Candidatus Dependentiae bacterium]